MTRITDCIFDLYGTLVDIWTDEEKEELWKSLAEEFAPLGMIEDPRELRRTYERLVRQEEDRLLHLYPDGYGEIDLAKVFAGLFEKNPEPPAAETVEQAGRRFRELSIVRLRLYPGVKTMLAALRKGGKRVWLLSNAQRIFTAYEIEALGLAPYFDGIYLSSDHRVKKPSLTFYRILLEEQGIDPGHAVMTGNDGTCDIRGAKSAGLRTLYLHSESSPELTCPEADHALEMPDMRRVTEILLGE